jgi:BON domain
MAHLAGLPVPAGTPGIRGGSRRQRWESGTQDSIVTLTGQVRTRAGHDAVVSAAWTANGIIGVRDELHVTG